MGIFRANINNLNTETKYIIQNKVANTGNAASELNSGKLRTFPVRGRVEGLNLGTLEYYQSSDLTSWPCCLFMVVARDCII